MMIISIAIFGDRRPFALNINQIMDKDGAIAEIYTSEGMRKVSPTQLCQRINCLKTGFNLLFSR